jgi:hypothetical protein
VKQGGICVFSNWQDDYVAYLTAIAAHLRGIVKAQITARHTVQFGDARSFKFPQREFDGLFSSPPYPNHRDFVSMFGPEQQFLELVGRKNNGGKRGALDDIIGSNFVSNKPPRRPESKIANAFFEAIRSLKRNKTARDDDENYYIPYFQNYFADLELAYRNVSMALAKGFEGYIVVVNNTHRGLIVPVAAFLVEAWKSMLYNAEVVKENELFHIGTKNPRARGTRARHTRYEIRIWDS